MTETSAPLVDEKGGDLPFCTVTETGAPGVGGAEPFFHAIDYASPDGDYSMMIDWQEGADGRLVIVGMGRLIEAAALPSPPKDAP